MRTALRSSAAAVAAAIALFTCASEAGAQNKCLAGKGKCIRKKTSGILNCYVRAAKDPVNQDTVFTACENKAKSKYDGGTDPAKGCFARLEAANDGPCPTVNDSEVVEGKVDEFIDDVTTDLQNAGHPPSTTNRCQGAKDKCVLKKTAALIKCHEKCAKDPSKCHTARDACLDKARAKFDGGTDPSKACFAKAEANGGCTTSNDVVPLEYKVDLFVTDVLCVAGYVATDIGCDPTPSPTTTPTSTNPTSTSTPTTPTPSCTCGPGCPGCPGLTPTATPTPP